MQPIISLDKVTRVFLTDELETHALAGIQLDIRPGEYVSISGPSGCGKSTLLSILGLLDTAYPVLAPTTATLVDQLPPLTNLVAHNCDFLTQAKNWRSAMSWGVPGNSQPAPDRSP